MGIPEGKRPLGRRKCRWEDNIKIYLEVGWGHGLDLSGSRWGQVTGFVNAVMNFRVLENAGFFLTS
jgi:hypothetical protein